MTRSVELEIHLFGPLRLQIDGVEVDTQRWKSKKALTLFKILAEGCGNRFPKDVLIDAMWDDEGDFERSSHNLHTVVYYLRRELEPNLKRYARPRLVRHAAGLYWLESSTDVRVDVVKFRHLMRKAESLRSQDAAASLETYTRALALYTDDFLPENLYCDWAAAPRESLREQFFAAASAVAELTLQLNTPRAIAINICRRALQRDSLREELHRALIHLLSAEGLFAEAAEQYRQCERLLQKEFRVSPSPETRAAYERLMAKAANPPDSTPSHAGTSQTMGTPATGAAARVERGQPSQPSQISSSARTSPSTRTPHFPHSTGELPGELGTPPVLHGGHETPPVPQRGQEPPSVRQGEFEMPSVAADGPTMCGRDAYLFLHKLELSRQVHTGLSMTLMRIGFPTDLNDKAGCIDVLRHTLRTGDVFCWESPRRLLIQLPATDDDGASLVKARLQHGLEQAGFVFFDIRHTVIDGSRSHIAAAAESVEEGSAS